MEFDEFQAVTRATIEECHRLDAPAMIGCTSTYTLGAVRRAAYAAECGADAIQVALPYWMEVPGDCIVPFFKEVSDAAPRLALAIYETRRAKVCLTLEQHQAVKEAVPAYLMVKANEGTLGESPEGCRQLSQFVNVFVAESLFGSLGRCGAKGGCSSVVYWYPAFVLELWRQVEAQNWEAVDAGCATLEKLFAFIFRQWGPRSFTDTGFDRLGGAASGFLDVSLRSRGPYPSAKYGDVEIWQNWVRENLPEILPS